MDFSNTLLVDAPMQAVFDYLARPENLPRWNYALSRCEQTSPGPTGAGSTFRQTRTLPRPAQESFTIAVFEPPKLLAFEGQFGPFHGTSTYALAEMAEGATRLINSFELGLSAALSPLAGLVGTRVKREVAQNLQILKEIMESRAGGRLVRPARSAGTRTGTSPTHDTRLGRRKRPSHHMADSGHG